MTIGPSRPIPDVQDLVQPIGREYQSPSGIDIAWAGKAKIAHVAIDCSLRHKQDVFSLGNAFPLLVCGSNLISKYASLHRECSRELGDLGVSDSNGHPPCSSNCVSY